MFIVMSARATDAEINAVKGVILAEGLQPHVNPGSERVVIALVGDVGPRRQSLMSRFEAMAGVETVTPITRPYKLTSREFHPEDTIIEVGDVRIGDGSLTVMAGPCSVESRDVALETAKAVAAAGARVLRGGAFKPR
ncbi:MAG: 3-deoxy-7-phosphoheptulonate synthase, partial [Candidatus Limnocylindrales bacterium]